MSKGTVGGDPSGIHKSHTMLPERSKSPADEDLQAKHRSRTVQRNYSPEPVVANTLPNQAPGTDLPNRKIAQKGPDTAPYRYDLTPRTLLQELDDLTGKVSRYADRYWSVQEHQIVEMQQGELVEREVVTDFGSKPMLMSSYLPVRNMLIPTLYQLKTLLPDTPGYKQLDKLLQTPMLGLPLKDWDDLEKVEAHFNPQPVSLPPVTDTTRENYIAARFHGRLNTLTKEIATFYGDFLEQYVKDNFGDDSDEYSAVMYGGDEGCTEFMASHGEEVIAAFCEKFAEELETDCTSEVLSYLKANKLQIDEKDREFLDEEIPLLDLAPDAVLQKYGVTPHAPSAAKVFEEDIRTALSDEYEDMQADSRDSLKPVDFGVSQREFADTLMQHLNTMRAMLIFEQGGNPGLPER